MLILSLIIAVFLVLIAVMMAVVGRMDAPFTQEYTLRQEPQDEIGVLEWDTATVSDTGFVQIEPKEENRWRLERDGDD